MQWFGDNIFGDLQAAAAGGVHPALQADAIWYIYTFRYQVRLVSSTCVGYLRPYLPRQLTKEQLVLVLPLLLNCLESQEVVVYTYAAVALDRILSMRIGVTMTLMYAFPLIASSSSSNFAGFHPRTSNRLRRSFSTSSLQRSESRTARSARRRMTSLCVVRVSFRSLHVGASSVVFPQVLRGVSSLRNKRSSGSTSLSCRDSSTSYAKSPPTRVTRTLINTYSKAYPVLSGYRAALDHRFRVCTLPSIHRNLQKDIDRTLSFQQTIIVLLLIVAEYIPYVFQILARMLTLHQGVPVDYRALLPHLLTPAIWGQKGSIPGLVALLPAFLARDAAAMVKANQHTLVQGIVQQRLMVSKANDGWGFAHNDAQHCRKDQ